MTSPLPVFQLENDMIVLILRGSFWLSGEQRDSAGGGGGVRGRGREGEEERWQK